MHIYLEFKPKNDSAVGRSCVDRVLGNSFC